MKRRFRKIIPVMSGVLLMLGSAAASVWERWDLAGVALAALTGLVAWVAWDVRARTADLSHMMRLAATRQRELDGRVTQLDSHIRVKLTPDARVERRLEAMERRALGVNEAERLATADRHRELSDNLTAHTDATRELAEARATDRQAVLDAIAASAGTLADRSRSLTDRVVRDLTAISRDQTRDVEALLQLIPRVSARAPMPPSGRWAMNARALLHLVDLVDRKQPKRVLELGGGTSTVWLGYALQGTGAQVVSVDHDPIFAALTEAAVERHGLSEHVSVRTAQLESLALGDDEFDWYAPSGYADLSEIDLLIVDGPPGSAGRMARYPALPQLKSRLNANAWVVLDDADRPDEVECVNRWIADTPGMNRVDEGVSRLAVLSCRS